MSSLPPGAPPGTPAVPPPFTPGRDELIRKIEEAYVLIGKAAAKGVIPYLNQLKINSSPEPRFFRDVADPWQWTLAQKLAPAVENVAGITEGYSGPRNFWLTLTKGSDKTGLLGRLSNFLLAFNRRPIEMVSASGDRDQANLLLDSMKKEAELNPWLAKRLYFKSYEVKGFKSSRLRVLSADAKTSHGYTPDITIVDEVTWWQKEDLYSSLNAARVKRPKVGVFIVITNAGVMHTWQWDRLQEAKRSSRWWVYEAPGPIASWMPQEEVEAVMRELPPAEAARMYQNSWLDPSESAGFLTRGEAQACANLGEEMGLTVRHAGDPKKLYLFSVDYGPTKDRTVCCVMHQEGGVVVIDRMDVWQGSKNARVPVSRVENWIQEVRNNYPIAVGVVDPHGLESTCQTLEAQMNLVRYESRGGKGNYAIFQALRSAVVNRRVAWYPGCGDVTVKGRAHTLVDELCELITRKMVYGFRIDTLPGKHDDRCVAMAQGLVQLLKSPLKKNLYFGDDWF